VNNARPHRKHRHPLWRRLRIYFRHFRMTVWMILLVVICAGLYLNMVGLPGFIQRPLIENLRAKGVDLEFSRLRLSYHRGIVADRPRFHSLDNPMLPDFTARSADLRLRLGALLERRVEIAGLELRDGRLLWELAPLGEPSRPIAITNINASLNFRPGDEWSIDRFEAGFKGARFNVLATITNATKLRDWAIIQAGGTQTLPGESLERLRRLQAALEATQFTGQPDVRLTLSGDAADPRSFNLLLHVVADGAATPWGDFTDGILRVNLAATRQATPLAAQLSLTAATAHTEWATLRNLALDLASSESADKEMLDCRGTLKAGQIKTRWAQAARVEAAAQWIHSTTNPLPQTSQVQLGLERLETRWGKSDSLALTASSRPASTAIETNASLSYWNWLLPHALELHAEITNASTTNFTVPKLSFGASWDAPRLAVTGLSFTLPDGHLAAHTDLDVVSRDLRFDGEAGFEFHRIGALLTEKSRAWIDQFQWSAPPGVQMAGELRLPEWTNRQPDWRTEVKPTIKLAGTVAITNGSYRGITADRVATRLAYTNHLWQLDDLTLDRPDGSLQVRLQSHELTHAYHVQVKGRLHPSALESQLDEKGRRGLGYIQSESAPELEGEVTGRWYERDTISARASVVWTNFSYRQQHMDRVEAAVTYSNLVLTALNPRVERGTEIATADLLQFDFAAHLGYITNGFCDTDPMAIATVIGPKVAEAVAPYQFLKPPKARINGIIPLKGEKDADLHFDLEGGPFHWTLFKLPHVTGHVCWANESVILSNMTANFYGGEAAGNAWFDVSQRGITPYGFQLNVTNVDLHALMADLHSPSNQLEGTLTGQLIVTEADTHNWDSWQGHGRVLLRDGMIWDSPIFGVMSSVMNSFVPGIGNSRASAARGSYIITNSVIHTKDLDIRASGMRLKYEGTVDFHTRVNARVEAELLRDAPFFGKAVSTVLTPLSKLFEYKVTGTLAKPDPVPLYFVPRMILAPLSPIRSLRSIFQGGPEEPVFEPYDLTPARPADPPTNPPEK
jgi:hypothetical protein